MGWRWRRVFGRGPFRVTLSKGGVGWSVGVPGLRYGRSPNGQPYISIGIPGTGLYCIKYLRRSVTRRPPGTTRVDARSRSESKHVPASPEIATPPESEWWRDHE